MFNYYSFRSSVTLHRWHIKNVISNARKAYYFTKNHINRWAIMRRQSIETRQRNGSQDPDLLMMSTVFGGYE